MRWDVHQTFAVVCVLQVRNFSPDRHIFVLLGDQAAVWEVEPGAQSHSSGSASSEPAARQHKHPAEGGRGADSGGEAGGVGRLSGPHALSVPHHHQPYHQVHPLLTHVEQKGQFTKQRKSAGNKLILQAFWISSIRSLNAMSSPADFSEPADSCRGRAGHVFYYGTGFYIHGHNAGTTECC